MITAPLLAYVGVSAVVTLVVAALFRRTREQVAVTLPIRNENLHLLTRDDGSRLDRAA